MKPRSWVTGVAALLVASGLAFGASQSGERVEFKNLAALRDKVQRLRLDASAAVFDESVVHTYTLQVDPADWKWLGDNSVLEQYRPATLKFGGRNYKDVAIRYKGSYGALFCFDAKGNQICDKLSLKLKFSEYDPSGRFYGLRGLNLHSMTRDPTRMHEALSYGMFRDAGIPGASNRLRQGRG